MTERCDGCRFWKRLGTTNEGECRKEAPRPLGFLPQPGMVGLATGRVGPLARWVRTEQDDWCGEFEKKTEAV